MFEGLSKAHMAGAVDAFQEEYCLKRENRIYLSI